MQPQRKKPSVVADARTNNIFETFWVEKLCTSYNQGLAQRVWTDILNDCTKIDTPTMFQNFFDKITSEFFLKDSNSNFDNEFLNSLYDDLNTPRALASLNKLFDKVKDQKKDDKKIILSLAKCFQLLGINLNKNNDESNFVTKSEKKIIFDLIQEREAARKLKDFERADNIRDKLKKMNINMEDSVEGTKWIKNE